MSKLIGTNPNQVPSNADLGTMAYVNASPIVAFNAGLNATFTSSGNSTPITFANTTGIGRCNIGGHYSTTGGVFVAPVDGVYQFHLNILVQGLGDGDNMEVYIRQNRDGSSNIVAIGSRMSYEPNATGTAGYMEGKVSTILYCQAGDEVYSSWYRQGSTGTIHANPAWSYFCGAKISLY